MPCAPFELIHTTDRVLPLYTVAQLRACERAALTGLAPHTLMARAGQAAARFILERLEDDRRPVWLAAGPGNNGGDALVCAEQLRRHGLDVIVCQPLPPQPDDARWALDEARHAGVRLETELPASLPDCSWAIDGLFGIGLARPLQGVFSTLAALLSEHCRQHGRVLALDVPSGLDSDTGNVIAPGTAVRASHTITFIAAKPGLYTGAGRDRSGEILVAPLELDAACVDDPVQFVRLNAPALFGSALPARGHATHKGSFGALALVGGGAGMCGAPILAARAALHAGPGKVHVGLLSPDGPAYDPPYPELMLQHIEQLDCGHLDALTIGPGMGTGEFARWVLQRLLPSRLPKVLDADALNLLASEPELGALLAPGHSTVLTPHPLEAARLLGTDTASVQADRIGAARALAARFHSVAVLKGSGTLIAAPDGRVALNPTGNAALATGGSGDVLGGVLGAFLAQHMPPFEAAAAAVYLHGRAADQLVAAGQGPAGLTAGELAPAIRALLNQLFYPVR